MFDAQGNLLAQSDGQSTGQPDPMIDQHVAAGTAYLEVQGPSGAGTFDVSTTLTPASDPDRTLALPPEFQEGNYAPIAVGDFNNNGILDIVAPDGVHPGVGDGTFQAPSADDALVDPTQYSDPSAIAVGDFNGDRNLDVAVALAATEASRSPWATGTGRSSPRRVALPAGGTPAAIVAGDFGTGHLDLAVADSTLDMVDILQGDGDGSFHLAESVPVGQDPCLDRRGRLRGQWPHRSGRRRPPFRRRHRPHE